MARYKFWDKAEPIYTLGKDENGKQIWTAAEYINEYAPWAANPEVKVLVAEGPINGMVFMEWTNTVSLYARQGTVLTDSMSDEEKLAAINDYMENPPAPPPGADERMAAMLEYLVMSGMDNAE